MCSVGLCLTVKAFDQYNKVVDDGLGTSQGSMTITLPGLWIMTALFPLGKPIPTAFIEDTLQWISNVQCRLSSVLVQSTGDHTNGRFNLRKMNAANERLVG